MWIKICWAIVTFISVLKCTKSSPISSDSCVKLDGRENCYSETQNPYRYYGSKTTYRTVFENETQYPYLQGCTPKVMYMLNRHGIRYPDDDDIWYINKYLPDLKEQILSSFQNGTAKLCQADIDKLKAWFPNMDVDDGELLSNSGAEATIELGQRMKSKFPDLLGRNFSQKFYTIEYTSRVRTKQTAQAFSKGVFNEEEYKKINFIGKENDAVLQFHKNCGRMMEICGLPDFDDEEAYNFLTGPLMEKVRESVSKRIGVTVSADDVKHMYIDCSFGFALKNSDAWCSVFSPDELKVLEYNEDIDDYWRRSYGNSINYEQACPLIRYVALTFKIYEITKRNRAVLHFTHSGAVKKVYTAFGLFHDDVPLTADNFCEIPDRKWRTSYISPFNSNIVFVLSECGGELKLLTLLNEKPVIISGCDSELCPLKKFYDKYMPMAKKCDLEQLCDKCSFFEKS